MFYRLTPDRENSHQRWPKNGGGSPVVFASCSCGPELHNLTIELIESDHGPRSVVEPVVEGRPRYRQVCDGRGVLRAEDELTKAVVVGVVISGSHGPRMAYEGGGSNPVDSPRSRMTATVLEFRT